ncbi:MAG: histidine kinase [Butyrivibrio sp.]|nr:histidine kinase [Acetatifactor muris]MCM1559823.1 histidine kinase [Butyrivibrio sp.]
MDRYYETEKELQLLVADKEGNILTNAGNRIVEEKTIRELLQGNQSCMRTGFSYQMAAGSLNYEDLSIIVIRPADYLKFWKHWEFWLLVILIPLITLIGFLVVYHMLNQVLLQPVNHLMERIVKRKTEASPEPQEEYREKIREYRVINRQLDQLVDELAQLEQEKYRKEKEAAAALLQYYQLQVNPHFFLNCLNILDSLTDRNNTANIKIMILALSKHFRYVFQDGQKLVSVREELEEVKAYCDIYRIKGGMPILLKLQADEELMEYRVPILCVQTFVENSVKYAFRDGQILSLEVTADIVPDDEERYLRIRIEDNGGGYPQEKLPDLNRPVTQFKYNSEHIGIDNIKYRIFILYGEKATICFYNNPSGGAATEILLLDAGAMRYCEGRLEDNAYLMRLIAMRTGEEPEDLTYLPVYVEILRTRKDLEGMENLLLRSVYQNVTDELICPLELWGIVMMKDGADDFLLLLCMSREEEPERAVILEKLENIRIIFKKLLETDIAIYCGEVCTAEGLQENCLPLFRAKKDNVRRESKVLRTAQSQSGEGGINYSFEIQLPFGKSSWSRES